MKFRNVLNQIKKTGKNYLLKCFEICKGNADLSHPSI